MYCDDTDVFASCRPEIEQVNSVFKMTEVCKFQLKDETNLFIVIFRKRSESSNFHSMTKCQQNVAGCQAAVNNLKSKTPQTPLL